MSAPIARSDRKAWAALAASLPRDSTAAKVCTGSVGRGSDSAFDAPDRRVGFQIVPFPFP